MPPTRWWTWSGRGRGAEAVVSGYHDATGDPAQNAELAKQRAFRCASYVAVGVPQDKIELKKPGAVDWHRPERRSAPVEVRLQ